jgi:hypothetical protein
MKTDDLIKTLAADTISRRPPQVVGAWALSLAVVLAAAVFFAALGPRADIEAAAQTVRFLFKFVVTLLLAGTAFHALYLLSMPGAASGRALRLLWAGPALLAGAIALELAVVPPAAWERRLIGSNAAICLTFIPLIALGPLVAFLGFLRMAAPTRPMLGGAVAGLLAGGLAATFYAAHCTDDSPLFVATWYSLAIAVPTIAGAAIGRSLLRW